MPNSTQQFIPIAGIKDGIIITKTGGYRVVFQVTALNFALKSEQEQNSLIMQYQSFLNSLHFPIEIVVRSKRLDLSPYLNNIRILATKQSNELIKAQTEDYVDFIDKLIGIANIMKKNFYVVVPYDPLASANSGIFDKLFKKTETFDHLKISETEYKTNTGKIRERGNIIASGLGGMGLHCNQLSTEELIETFYQIYNPEVALKERIENAEVLASPVILSQNEIGGSSKPAVAERGDEQLIDNKAIIQEKERIESEERAQEVAKGAEKQERAPGDVASEPAPSPKIGIVSPPPSPAPSAATPAPNPPAQTNIANNNQPAVAQPQPPAQAQTKI